MRVVTDLPFLQNCVPAIPRDDICNNYIHTTFKRKENKLETKKISSPLPSKDRKLG